MRVELGIDSAKGCALYKDAKGPNMSLGDNILTVPVANAVNHKCQEGASSGK